MPRVNLTDEEAHMIEQRRMLENKLNLGFNSGINEAIRILSHWQGNLGQMGVDHTSYEAMTSEITELRKAIKP